MALQDEYSPGYFLDRYADLLKSIQIGDLDEARDQLAELEPLHERALPVITPLPRAFNGPLRRWAWKPT